MQKVSRNTYVETGFRGCNTGFVVTKDGVVLIDTPQFPADAVKWQQEISRRGEIRYLINTEPHGDHFSGNYFFSGNVVAHEGTREAILATSVEQLKERVNQTDRQSLPLMEGFRFRPPTITLSERLTLYLGEHTFQLIHLPGHSPFQVAVYMPEEKVVFTSDNVSYKIQPWLHQALPYDWLNSLKQLQQLDAEVLVPGHGGTCNRDYIPELSAYIQDWIDTITNAIKQGMSVEEAQDKISFLDRYPMSPGSEAMGPQLQRMNVARLYEVLKQ